MDRRLELRIKLCLLAIIVAFIVIGCGYAYKAVGLTEEQGSEFFHQYQSQGWLKGNGLPITDLRSQMVLWRNRQAERGQIPPAERNGQGRTPLQRYDEESRR